MLYFSCLLLSSMVTIWCSLSLLNLNKFIYWDSTISSCMFFNARAVPRNENDCKLFTDAQWWLNWLRSKVPRFKSHKTFFMRVYGIHTLISGNPHLRIPWYNLVQEIVLSKSNKVSVTSIHRVSLPPRAHLSKLGWASFLCNLKAWFDYFFPLSRPFLVNITVVVDTFL